MATREEWNQTGGGIFVTPEVVKATMQEYEYDNWEDAVKFLTANPAILHVANRAVNLVYNEIDEEDRIWEQKRVTAERSRR